MPDTQKTVPISGRIAQEDYEYIMTNPFGGKVTASEKLRHIASFFRSYHEHLGDYPECLEELNHLLEPARKNLKRLENELGTRSEIVDHATSLLPQAMAYLISRQTPPNPKRNLPYLLETEEHLLTLCLRLAEHILRLGLTREAPAYNPHVLDQKLNTLIELIGLLSHTPHHKPANHPSHER